MGDTIQDKEMTQNIWKYLTLRKIQKGAVKFKPKSSNVR
jgi:hypothetical protein